MSICLNAKQIEVVNKLSELGIKISKIATSDVTRSDNLIMPTRDKKGMVKMELKETKITHHK